MNNNTVEKNVLINFEADTASAEQKIKRMEAGIKRVENRIFKKGALTLEGLDKYTSMKDQLDKYKSESGMRVAAHKKANDAIKRLDDIMNRKKINAQKLPVEREYEKVFSVRARLADPATRAKVLDSLANKETTRISELQSRFDESFGGISNATPKMKSLDPGYREKLESFKYNQYIKAEALAESALADRQRMYENMFGSLSNATPKMKSLDQAYKNKVASFRQKQSDKLATAAIKDIENKQQMYNSLFSDNLNMTLRQRQLDSATMKKLRTRAEKKYADKQASYENVFSRRNMLSQRASSTWRRITDAAPLNSSNVNNQKGMFQSIKDRISEARGKTKPIEAAHSAQYNSIFSKMKGAVRTMVLFLGSIMMIVAAVSKLTSALITLGEKMTDVSDDMIKTKYYKGRMGEAENKAFDRAVSEHSRLTGATKGQVSSDLVVGLSTMSRSGFTAKAKDIENLQLASYLYAETSANKANGERMSSSEAMKRMSGLALGRVKPQQAEMQAYKHTKDMSQNLENIVNILKKGELAELALSRISPTANIEKMKNAPRALLESIVEGSHKMVEEYLTNSAKYVQELFGQKEGSALPKMGKEAVQSLGDMASKISFFNATGDDTIAKITKVVIQTIAILANIWILIKPMVDKILDDILAITTVLERFSSYLIDAAYSEEGFFATIISDGIELIKDYFTNFSFSERLAMAINHFRDKIDFAGMIFGQENASEKILKAMSGIFEAITSKVVSFIDGITDGIKNGAIGIFDGIKTTAEDILNGVHSGFKFMVDPRGDNSGTLGTTVLGGASSFLDGLNSSMGSSFTEKPVYSTGARGSTFLDDVSNNMKKRQKTGFSMMAANPTGGWNDNFLAGYKDNTDSKKDPFVANHFMYKAQGGAPGGTIINATNVTLNPNADGTHDVSFGQNQ